MLLYAHYDVQPAPPEQGWDTDPFIATTRPDGRIYGRGAADDKSGLIIHAGTLQALGGDIPVGVKILIEGEEETISHLEDFVDANPEMFDCDAFVIADMGNQAVGRPALTTALRGEVSCTVRVRTLAFPVHSGRLRRRRAGRADRVDQDAGRPCTTTPATPSCRGWRPANVAGRGRRRAGLPGQLRHPATGSTWSAPARCPPGCGRSRRRPSSGSTRRSVAEAANILIPEATAKVSMRIVPGADAEHELELLVAHLRSVAPWHVEVEVTPIKAGWPFAVDMNGPAVLAAEAGLTEAFGTPVEAIGSGGSIPLINSLKNACPRADVILWGAEDTALSRIHASNESVDPTEIERMITAQVLTLQKLGSA